MVNELFDDRNGDAKNEIILIGDTFDDKNSDDEEDSDDNNDDDDDDEEDEDYDLSCLDKNILNYKKMNLLMMKMKNLNTFINLMILKNNFALKL